MVHYSVTLQFVGFQLLGLGNRHHPILLWKKAWIHAAHGARSARWIVQWHLAGAKGASERTKQC